MKSASEPFPTRHVAAIDPRPAEAAWLVEPLWARGGVGIVGGAPKACKTWLGCELALAVASGRPALGRFAVKQPGPVLFYGAEDDQPSLRARFDAIARARGASLDDAQLFLLDVAELRLDRDDHVARLGGTIARLRPALVVLDPFVRLARIDENSAAEVSGVLGSLRALQREHGTAVLLAHHMRKSSASHLGYQLRGSGDFAAWYDSALYLSRRGDDLALHVEHRAAPAPPPLRLRLATGDSPHLFVVDGGSAAPEPGAGGGDPLPAAVLERLQVASRPISTAELRDTLRVRKQTLTDTLVALERDRLIARHEGGWVATKQA